jgi:Ni,Fe-hydrogenase I large subunit
MPTNIHIGPVTRVEGHLEVDVTVDTVNGVQPGDLSCSLEMTAKIQNAVPKAVAMVLMELGKENENRVGLTRQ